MAAHSFVQDQPDGLARPLGALRGNWGPLVPGGSPEAALRGGAMSAGRGPIHVAPEGRAPPIADVPHFLGFEHEEHATCVGP